MVQLPRWQRILVLFVLLLGLLYTLPNVLPRSALEGVPDWLPHDPVNLGLDLRGGSYLLLEVDLEALEVEQLRNLSAGVLGLMRENRIGIANLGVRDGGVTFELRDQTKRDEVVSLIQQQMGDVVVTVADSGRVRVDFSEQFLEEKRASVVTQAIEIVRRRIDETGTREPAIQRQGELRILVQLPGVENPDELKQILGTTAKMTFRFVLDNVRAGVDPTPPGASVLDMENEGAGGNPVKLVVSDRVMVSGENLVDAQLAFEQGRPVVSFRFDTVGGRQFCNATRDNVNRLFAIVLDEKVISAPRINEPICGGAGQISGQFTQASASNLALLLRAGALPAPLDILEERTVGPGLGADSIEAGEVASIVGIILVVVFMTAAYGLFGFYASIALAINLLLLLAALTGLQATLTLPGIAGVALTLGMAVDANVLIFERMREEARHGRGPTMAIDSGFRRALTTIIDSNVTTLIAALLLFQFGTGPIKGFAVTLSLGLITSMFTAIMVTRWMVVAWLAHKKRAALPI